MNVFYCLFPPSYTTRPPFFTIDFFILSRDILFPSSSSSLSSSHSFVCRNEWMEKLFNKKNIFQRQAPLTPPPPHHPPPLIEYWFNGKYCRRSVVVGARQNEWEQNETRERNERKRFIMLSNWREKTNIISSFLLFARFSFLTFHYAEMILLNDDDDDHDVWMKDYCSFCKKNSCCSFKWIKVIFLGLGNSLYIDENHKNVTLVGCPILHSLPLYVVD